MFSNITFLDYSVLLYGSKINTHTQNIQLIKSEIITGRFSSRKNFKLTKMFLPG